ncbi:MAG: hypothetical protein LLG09_09340 [Negativicutes bacterium]|nr:hypothetical protein [Negativicutes bacterium]
MLRLAAGGALSGKGVTYMIMITCGGTWAANCVSGLGWIAVVPVIFTSIRNSREIQQPVRVRSQLLSRETLALRCGNRSAD